MQYVTTGDIARENDSDRDSVNYAIRKTGLRPAGRAGLVRLYPNTAVKIVGDFLATKRQINKGTPQ